MRITDVTARTDAPIPSSTPSSIPLPVRRAVFGALVIGSWVALTAAMLAVLSPGGLRWTEIGMLVCFSVTLPWLLLGFWNALIGFVLAQRHRDPLDAIGRPPGTDRDSTTAPITTRTAIVMAIYNEDAERVFRHLRTTVASLDATGETAAFDIHVLSDTNRPDIAAEEDRLFARWQAEDGAPGRLFLRRRTDNAGFKAGNLREFADRCGHEYDNMIVLDADSVMTGPAMLRLVRAMQADPRLGILQTLVTGMPTESAFARIFQFGMRHGMRAFTLGSAWWQGACGPYWGHNAILRLAPFRDHCRLPMLPGRPPLGGHVLSHDQVEAVLMRRAGYAVRVLPDEFGSYEENPPTLPDFVKRDLRWCQGNMQYFQLLSMPGLHPLSRLQLVLAIMMYMGGPFWMGFLAFGFGQAAMDALTGPPAAGAPLAVPWFSDVSPGHGLAMFAGMMVIVFAPKIFGVLDVLCDGGRRRAYGGTGRVLGGFGVENLFSFIMGPVMALAHTIFMVGLLFGKQVRWEAQARDGHAIPWTDALAGLWPQTLAGLGATALLGATAPAALPWAAPLLLGWLLAVPFAVTTAGRPFGDTLTSLGACAIPEEFRPPREIRDLGLTPRHRRLLEGRQRRLAARTAPTGTNPLPGGGALSPVPMSAGHAIPAAPAE